MSFEGSSDGFPDTSIKFKFGNSPSGDMYLKLLSLIEITFNVVTEDNESGKNSKSLDAKPRSPNYQTHKNLEEYTKLNSGVNPNTL